MQVNKNMLGGWAIDVECFEKILEILPKGKTILELGSGAGSGELSKYYNVYSIEHDPRWLNKYKTNYIHAPLSPIIRDDSYIMWYDPEKLKGKLPQEYDMIIIDGPQGGLSPKRNSREGFLIHMDLFNTKNKILIFDDVNREEDLLVMQKITSALGINYKVYNSGKNSQPKKFGVAYTN